MGAVLDRNGLRPSRYYITKDGNLILSSEVGALPIPSDNIVEKERLRPGKMLLVDTVQGRVIDDDELKEYYASKQPYGEWLDSNLVRLKDLKIPNIKVEEHGYEERQRLQKAFGYTYEDVMTSILPMAKNGSESIAAMGTDSPLAVLSKEPQPLFNYFKQLFAQVTNPPIDAIREEIVTSTTVYIGEDGNILEEKPENCKVMKIHDPILTSTDILKIKNMHIPGFKVAVIPILYYKNTRLEKAINRLYIEADKAFSEGANILILQTGELTRTTLLSHHCLLYQRFISTLLLQRREHLLLLSSKAASLEKFITLQHCLAMVLPLSTLILLRKLSTSLLLTTFSIRITMPLLTIIMRLFSMVS